MAGKSGTIIHQMKNVEVLTNYEKKLWETYLKHGRRMKPTAEALNMKLGGVSSTISLVKEKLELQEALKNAD